MKLLEIPFAYKAEYAPLRGRRPKAAWILDSVPVRLAEVSERDAPVAAVMTTNMPESLQVDLLERPVRVDYRVLEGRLLRPYYAGMLMADDNGGNAAPMPWQAAQADLAAWRARIAGNGGPEYASPEWRLAYRSGFAPRVGATAVPRGAVGALEWLSDDRAARRATISTALDGKAALVGGILHVPSLGPAWWTNSCGFVVASSEFALGFPRQDLFAADRKAHAQEHADYLAAEAHGAGHPRSPALGAIDIIDPAPFAALARSIDELVVRAVAARISGDDYGRFVWESDPDVIVAFADAKRIAAASEIPDLLGAAEMLSALEGNLRRTMSARGGTPQTRLPYGESLLHRLRSAPMLGDMPAPRGP